MNAPDTAHEARERIDLPGGYSLRRVLRSADSQDGWYIFNPSGCREVWFCATESHARAFAAAMQVREARIAELEAALKLAANRIDRLSLEVTNLRFAAEASDWAGEARSALARYHAALANTGAPVREGWLPISSVSHEDGTQVWLRAPGARDAVWEWSERSRRWERADGLHWSESGDGLDPQEWRAVR